VSFGVIVNERTAPAAAGAPTDTSQVFVAGQVSNGPTDEVTVCKSTSDFEAAYGSRQGTEVGLWDWLDVAFREGVTTAIVGGYSAAGDYDSAFDLFDSRLGPGQVAVVGEPASAAVYQAIQTHVDANNRIGLLDVASGDALSQITAHGDNAQALPNMENVGVFGSFATCSGPAGSVSVTSRSVQASAVIAGLCARVDTDGNPNRAAGGYDYPLQYVNGFEYDPDDTDRAACFQHGVNMFANRWGVLENYGFQTPVAQSVNTPFWQLNCSRTRMWMKAQAQAIGERYYMRPIDGQGKVAGQLGGDLADMCSELYSRDGLYGATPSDAYSVNVSVNINTSDTAAQAVLRAIVQARLSEYAKQIIIDLVSVPVAGVVS
jgi:hypothetical protein